MSHDLCVDMSHFTGMNGCVQCDLVGHPCCTAGETPNMQFTGKSTLPLPEMSLVPLLLWSSVAS